MAEVVNIVPKQNYGILAMFWDGSQSEAGIIIEWVESHNASARFRETNETVHHTGPEIRLNSDAGMYVVHPNQWVVLTYQWDSAVFKPMSQTDFENTYQRITE